jgi:hypothetical protein
MIDTRSLLRTLNEIGVPAPTVTVRTPKEGRHCIRRTDDGRWETFYFQDGKKLGHTIVPTEYVACTYLLGLLAHQQALSGKLTVV